ncbi:MAG: succinate dehydrogenase assembly factor 2 [Rhodobacteraceae bacterium]|nr:succinate dehydrogenase assembly factor 2 [Paracoccaceae bacterium]
MSEAREIRVRRMKMRSMRRGIREMDLILTAFADARLDDMGAGDLDLYDALLNENDHDLYQWVTGQVPPPGRYGGLIAEISQAIAK